MIKTSELQNAKYIFIQVVKADFCFINSRSRAEFWYNLENWKEPVCSLLLISTILLCLQIANRAETSHSFDSTFATR